MKDLTYQTGQFSISNHFQYQQCCAYLGYIVHLPSSKMTLSPKTITSNSSFDMSRLSMFLLGLLRAFESSAQIPIFPIRAMLTTSTCELSGLGCW